jgi:hypothetical protein
VSTPEDKAADAVEEETTATEVGDYEAEAVDTDDTEAVAPAEPEPGSRWARVLAFGVLPVLALLLGGAAGYLRYDYSSRHDADTAGTESVQAARDSTIALLSYKPESVDKDLTAARDRLTGSFLDAYTQLVNTVVIPGAKEEDLRGGSGARCGIGVGQTRSCGGAGLRRPDRRRRQRRADPHRLQCADHAGEGRRPLADLRIRTGLADDAGTALDRRRRPGGADSRAHLGTGRRPDRVVPARLSRHHTASASWPPRWWRPATG